MLKTRQAVATDAASMCEILTQILFAWNSKRPRAPAHVRKFYIDHPDRVSCAVALNEADRIVGFQSLKVVGEGNPYGLPEGWGVIGTNVNAEKTRHGIGRTLFSVTLGAAQTARLLRIDATIAASSAPALAYYDTMGFRTFRTGPGTIQKMYLVDYRVS